MTGDRDALRFAISMPTCPDNDSSPERQPTEVEQAALGWVVRSERGLAPEQQEELAAWIGAHSRHRELFEEFGGTWAVMGHAEVLPPRSLAEAPAGERALLPIDRACAGSGIRRRSRRIVRALWLPLAAAAAVAIAYVVGRVPAHEEVSFVTAVGASRQLTLSDGSVVQMNTDSALVAAFTDAERRVRLARGEAYFQVAKDADRPFVVEAAGIGVRAVGTAFNVRVRSETVEVLVTEGRVRVAAERTENAGPGARPEVAAGERVVLPVSLAAVPPEAFVPQRVPDDQVRRMLAWQERQLVFWDTPLSDMVAEFNRYSQHSLIVNDAAVAAMRFGGSFPVDDRAGFVRMLRENFGIRVEERESVTILRAAR